ncbi:MAG TPA: hypothetical protein VG347_04690, partial [Verrucomicrobiae bacterium]|nr:hypothetical protein [Verrucomicrobiae bacterium]
MQTNSFFKKPWFFAALLCLSIASTRAASVTNADNTTTLNLGGSWVGGTAAGAGDVAVWNNVVQANTTKALGANLSWSGIQILDPLGLISVSAGNTLTLGTAGVDLSRATNSLTLSCPVVLGANQTWNVTNGLTLTAGGVVSGAGVLTLNSGANSGTIVLSTANTYSSGTFINGGIVQPASATSFGPAAGVITNNGATLLFSTLPA